MKLPVYLDYAATTPVDPRVADAMARCLTMDGMFANPASRSHIYGWQAEEQVELARRQVAELLRADPREVVWTSGATESNNLALKGVFEALNFQGHLITTAVEHKAVIDPAKWLEARGVAVTYLMPGTDGRISVEQVQAALRPDTRLVSVMHINNETGVVNPVAEVGALCRAANVLMHVDAAQSAGKIALDVSALQVDLLSLSAHKFYGPKGVGALYVRRAIAQQVKPQIHGGGHERGLRSGTLATHQLVGIGEAARLCVEQQQVDAERTARLRDQLWQGISTLPAIARNGSTEWLSPIHLNVNFGALDGETLLLSLRDIAVSSGSACTSASMEPSYVLKAMGLSDAQAHSSVRISLGRFTTAEDVQRAVAHIVDVVGALQPVHG
ncbi:aminotransferase class V-fold PLP-dependent enzyme [Simiduia curdlanivorans]|uniref:cysteine desulfurase n=1 Tax=Simiduia curdlanivorans TaxID=1492769 RepID=A0ABV8V0B6_9GAMM|nr:aminotransferase class V-fold PLP-dependent enzyme [Simiduia curdlanivorans]MDN3637193.1 aminotransferase class V-fold PLP-dependent enzyme [Simiduia curdlanivorans]MDN3637201.1 aminotransferase class V-fold PLP-dependent enzyme [Simiduia curdlanivorans]MDN3639250.1 aminotransferase class V-fold PLP-dependent enzyme [Simiduia curdlanivorans]